ncbi:MAG: hypothetical protein QOF89_3450 [Acidobacteriota bacterium]|nr:hypothetical protein [Acidobacteriota bacterium]
MPQAPGYARNRQGLRRAVGGSVLIFLLAGAVASYAAGTLELVSRVDPSQVSDTGSSALPFAPPLASDPPSPPSISADGRYVAFVSPAANLVPGQDDMNGWEGDSGRDVFLADLVGGTVTLVSHSLSSSTMTGNQGSREAVISADGRYVAFTSAATDLVPSQEGNVNFPDEDLLLFDRVTGAITLVAATRDELSGFSDLAINADGRYVTFVSDAGDVIPGLQGGFSVKVFLYDRVEGTSRLVSHVSGADNTADGASGGPGISADGRFIVFRSSGNLVPGQLQTSNIFLYDRQPGAVTLVGPGEAAAISADGKYIAFNPGSTLQLQARETGVTSLVSSPENSPGGSYNTFSLNADGRFVAFIRGLPQIGTFGEELAVYDRVSGTVTASHSLSASPDNYRAGAPTLSADGHFVAFTSSAPDLMTGQTDANHTFDVFLFDRTSGKTTLVSSTSASLFITGNGSSLAPVLSADGSRIAFFSTATDLQNLKDLNEGLDLVVYDVATKSNTVITLRAPSLPSLSPAADSGAGSLSADGRFVAFVSRSSHLVAGQVDTNGTSDVFLYDRSTKTTVLVSRAPSSTATAAHGESIGPVVNADGRFVAFVSTAGDLVPGGNPGGQGNLFLFDRVAGTVSLVARTALPLNSNAPFSVFPERMSPDGRWLAFVSSAAGLVPGQQDPPPAPDGSRDSNVFLWDRVTGLLTLVSHASTGPTVTATGFSSNPVLSADSRYLAFNSTATDLIPGQAGDPGNLFLYDRVTGTTTLVSHAPGSALTGATAEETPALSADGRFIVFGSEADLGPGAPLLGRMGLYLHDRTLQTFKRIGSYFIFAQPTISADGRYVAFVSDRELVPGIHTGGDSQIYLYDRISDSLSVVSRSASASNFAGVGHSQSPTMSADGRYIAFYSRAHDLVPGEVSAPGRDEGDVLLFDQATGTLTLLSHSKRSPVEAVGWSDNPSISASGLQVAFTNRNDIAEGDLNLRDDVFVFSQDPAPPPGPTFPCTVFEALSLRSNVRKVFPVGGTCGVPATAKQVTVKVTASEGTKQGTVQLYPGNVTRKPGTLRFNRRQTVSGTFKLSLATNGTGTLALLPTVANKGTVHVIVEVLGYTL